MYYATGWSITTSSGIPYNRRPSSFCLIWDRLMEILEIRTLRGPNYWSGYWKKLIIMRVDIGAYEKKPTDKIQGFYERMTELMPSLVTHGCSYGEKSGFLKRVVEGTWA